MPPPEGTFNTYTVCGVQIAALDRPQAARVILNAAQRGSALEVHLCNAYTLSLVDSNPELRAALHSSDLNLADGSPVAWLGRAQGMAGPVRGPNLVIDVARLGGGSINHFFWGARPGVAARMAKRISDLVPDLKVVGTESPPFGDPESSALDKLAEKLRASNAHLLWVGMGTPRQDLLVPRLAKRAQIPVVPVGAAFDFWAGTVREAPKFLHGTGLEWTYRLMHEPQRLWRRYLIGNPKFVLQVIRSRGSDRLR